MFRYDENNLPFLFVMLYIQYDLPRTLFCWIAPKLVIKNFVCLLQKKNNNKFLRDLLTYKSSTKWNIEVLDRECSVEKINNMFILKKVKTEAEIEFDSDSNDSSSEKTCNLNSNLNPTFQCEEFDFENRYKERIEINQDQGIK